mgnify:CR=1 FL=1
MILNFSALYSISSLKAIAIYIQYGNLQKNTFNGYFIVLEYAPKRNV